jgi:CubicO group peptidase (beta-lactamase class C family)
MKSKIAVSIISIASLLSHGSFAQSTNDKEVQGRIQQIEQDVLDGKHKDDGTTWSIKDRMLYYKINGLSIAIVHNYKIEWAKGFGWADVKENRPVTTETVFQAASISVGVLTLVQDKRLDLNSDINNYLTSWKFPYDSISKDKKITLAALLSHTAGLGVHGFDGYEPGKPLPTITQILDGLKPANSPAVRSEFMPGIEFQYSGGGIVITEAIIQDITHQPYDKFMFENVLNPFGMIHSFYTQPPPAEKKLVLATAYDSIGNEIPGKYHIYPEQAPAGLWSNPTDLCKYIIETQLSYQGKSEKVLSQRMTRLRLTPVYGIFALGVFITNENGIKLFSHDGSNEGFNCMYAGTLEHGNGVVIMVNSDERDILDELFKRVEAVYKW